MSDIVLSKISTLLQAKLHEPNPMSRGAFVKDLVDALDIPVSTINLALSNEMSAAKWGIYKMTPNKRRNVLWGYSKDIADKANALPFNVDDLTGIDPIVQAAEVSKLVEPCADPEDHKRIQTMRNNLQMVRNTHGLSVDEWDDTKLSIEIFMIADEYWEMFHEIKEI